MSLATPRNPPCRYRSGFTLVELLVVITIIAILIGLLLSGVQMAREAARRAACGNNLKQMSLAAQNHEAAMGWFPPGGTVPPSDWELDLRGGRCWSWIVLILPYMEQELLYNQFDPSKTIFDQSLDPQTAQPPSLLCPSDGARGRFFVDSNLTKGKRFAKGNYAAFVSPFHTDLQFLYPGAISLSPGSTATSSMGQRSQEITDGLSSTLMLSEVRTREHQQDQRGVWALPWTGSTALAEDIHDASNTSARHPFVPDERYRVCAQVPNNDIDNSNMDMLYLAPDLQGSQLDGMPCAQWTEGYTQEHYLSAAPRSQHPGGVNVSFADGRVAFLPNSVDAIVMVRLISIDDGLSVDLSQGAR